jgi:dihydroxyacetone kinase-like protein
MNVKMAKSLAGDDDIIVKTVIANDDVASAPVTEKEKRRGVAGEVLMWKTGGAKAAQGANLDEVIAAAQKAIDNTRSIGIGLTPCTIPAVGKPNFTIAEGKMELGIGHHGEPGVAVTDLTDAGQMAAMCLDRILNDDIDFCDGSKVVVLVSGLGATPVMELYIFFREVASLLDQKGIAIHRSYTGNYFTSLEMMGVTLTVMKLDKELESLVDMEANAVALKQF